MYFQTKNTLKTIIIIISNKLLIKNNSQALNKK